MENYEGKKNGSEDIENESYGLRPKAQPYKYEDLKNSQKEAVKELLIKLHKAIIALDEFAGDKKNEKNNDKTVFPIIKRNLNRITFLSGGRGSGKTSVLQSLIKLLDTEANEYTFNEDNEVNIKKIVEVGKNRVVWLRPIQMETLPNSTNMLVAVLSRINEAIGRFDKRDDKEGSSYEEYPFALNQEAQKALWEFERLQRDVAMAWDGNLDKRSTHMDPDTYAVELLRAEGNRFKIEHKLTKILEDLNRFFIRTSGNNESIFVLPVDDFDSNPQRSEHLVKLVHLTSVPYIFTIILGDINITRNIFNHNLRKLLSSVEKDSSINNLSLSQRIAHESSANAIRKLFPLSHIIKLNPMNHNEVLNFKPSGADYSIADLMGFVEIEINTRKNNEQFVFGKEIATLRDFLIAEVDDFVGGNKSFEQKVDGENSNKKEVHLKDCFYIVPTMFKMYPRHVQDLWRYLRRLVLEEENAINQDHKKSNTGKQFAYEQFIQCAREDRELSIEISEALFNSVGKDYCGEFRIITDNMRMDCYEGPAIREYGDNSSFLLRLPKDWVCQIGIEDNNKECSKKWVNIREETSTAMMLFHDLVVLSRPSGTMGLSLMKKLDAPYWAYTLWPFGNTGGISVRWLAPPWRSLWAHDLLRRSWVRVWEWINENQIENKREFAAYCWIKICTGVFNEEKNNDFKLLILPSEIETSSKPFVFKGSVKLTICWNSLIDVINKLVMEEKENSRSQNLLRGWLARLACILSPEADLPENLTKCFMDGELSDFWRNQEVAHETRLLRAKSAVEFFDKGVFGKLEELYRPVSRELDDPPGINNGVKGINKISELRPYFEDIVYLSRLDNITKRRYEKLLKKALGY